MKRFWKLALCLILVLALWPALGVESEAVEVTPVSAPMYGRSLLEAMPNSTALLYAYDQLAAGIEASLEEIDVYNEVDDISEEEIKMVMDLYGRDYTYHFWMGKTWYYYLNGKTVLTIVPSYSLSGDALDQAKEQFDSAADQILAGVKPGMSQYETELYLHDTLIGQVEYVSGANAHDAYGALVDGLAVCEGYAEAYQYLLQRCGIQSFIVKGASNPPDGGAQIAHAWNAVNINGKFYHVDATWDDQGDNIYHSYFNVSDTMIFRDHAITLTTYSVPTCNSTDAFYFNCSGTTLQGYTTEAVGKLLKTNNGKVHVYIPGDANQFISWFKTNIRDVAKEAGITGGFSYKYSTLGQEVILEIPQLQTHTHDYGAGVVTTGPTCTAEGLKTFTCACGDAYTEVIPAKGHSFSDNVCTECGFATMGGTFGWDFNPITNTLTICGTGNMPALDYGNLPWGEYRDKIENLVISDGVTSVSGFAFFLHTNLKKVSLPEGIVKLEKGAFSSCYALSEINLPDSLKILEWNAFWSCPSYSKVVLPKNVTQMGEDIFGCVSHDYIRFTGNAPTFHEKTFVDIQSIVYYPYGNETWTTDVRQNYGGTIIWVPDCCMKGNTWVDATCTTPRTCTLCGRTEGAPLGHTEVIDNAVAATCTAKGLTEGKHCSVCSEVLVAQVTVAAKGHEEIAEAAVEATCTMAGKTEGRHCGRCGEILLAQQTLPALGHEKQTLPALEPSCTGTGLTEGESCSRCGEIFTQQVTVPALGHENMVDAAVAPTCSATGLTEGAHCNRCGQILVAQTVVDKIPHTPVAVPAVAPSCAASGLTEGSKCSACGETLTAQSTVPALEHSRQPISGKEPTCTEKGLTDGEVCGLCGTTLAAQELIPALGHTPVVVPGYGASCTAEGLTDGEKCLICGVVTKEQTPIPATGHSWAEGICVNCGITCDHSYDENGSCTNCGGGCAHDYETETVAPTCAEQGYTVNTCTLCGSSYREGYTDALGHDWILATCTDPMTCRRCGETGGEANGHNYAVSVIAPTCTETGYTAYGCAVCGHSYTDSYTEPLGHTPGVPVEENRTEPTCTDEGKYVTVVLCTVCETEVSREETAIPAKGHSNTDTLTAPACTQQGYTTHTCMICGHVTVDSYTPATGHSYGEWGIFADATCTDEGERRRVCETCSHFEAEAIPAVGHDWDGDICGRCGGSNSPYLVVINGITGVESVYVDGRKYPVTEITNGIQVELEDGNAKSLVIYTYNEDAVDAHTEYPISMRVWLLRWEQDGYTASYVPEFDNLLRYSGSSIRVTGKKGIRMITSIDKTLRQQLMGAGVQGYTLVEYGTAIAWADNLNQGKNLVLGESHTLSNYAYKKGEADPIFQETADSIQYTNVLVGFNEEQCKPDLAMRPYIILENGAGERITLYGGIVQRSIGYIAYQNRDSFSNETEAYEYIWNIIHLVYGSVYDKEYNPAWSDPSL